MTRVIGALGIAVLVMIGPAAAQEKPDVPSSVPEAPLSWAAGPSLTGDWGGLRTRLDERGVAPYAIYSVEGFGTVRGGSPNGADWTSELEFGST